MQLPQPGDRFEGKFDIVRRLGVGGFANVFLAIDLDVGREVALKVLTPRDDASREGPNGGGQQQTSVEARFMREAQVLASLQDPHTIRLFTYGRASSGLLYMVFQYVAGQDLSDLLARTGRLAVPVAIHITLQVLSALEEAHHAGVLHRDLKPANILIYPHLQDPFAVKLLDFGIAKVDPSVGGTNLTKTGVMVGTPRYMAPEQVFGEPFGPAADLYAIGLLLFEMLAGQPAVSGDAQQVLAWHLAEREHVVPPGLAGPAVTAVLQRTLALQPARRFASARELSAALERAVAQDAQPQRHHSQPLPQQTAPLSHTTQPATSPVRPTPATGASRWVLAAVALVAVALVALWASDEPDAPPPAVTQPVAGGSLFGNPDDEVAPEVDAVDVGAPRDVQAPDLGEGADASNARTGCGVPLERGANTFPAVRDLTVRVRVPNSYDENKKYPVVLLFHPEMITESKFESEIHLPDLTRESKLEDFLIVPVPSGSQWDPWARNDEIEAADEVLQRVKEQLCVGDRVFVLGHSDGAEMARRYACARPVSGLVLTSYLPHPRLRWCEDPPPTLWVHGLHDDVMPYAGGSPCGTRSVVTGVEFTEQLLRAHGCEDATPSRDEACHDYTCDTPLRICLVEGGHNHSRAALYLIKYPACDRIAMKLPRMEVWDFFAKHGRDIAPE